MVVLAKMPNLTKLEIFGSAILGFLIAVFFLVLSYTTTTIIRPDEPPPFYFWFSLAVLPGLSSLGLLILNDLRNKLTRKFSKVYQFYKFSLVGILNTLLDATIFNGFITDTLIMQGNLVTFFKGISFTAAVTNSFFWNKYWTFGSARKLSAKEFICFLIISLGGLGISISVVQIVVNESGPLWGISSFMWANIAEAFAIVFSTIWNFAGYKYVVFKRT